MIGVESGEKMSKPMRSKYLVAFCSFLGAASLLVAQSSSSQPPKKRETVAKPMTEKQKKKQEAKLRKELETPYKKWLNEDVVYIITDEETQGVQAAADRRGARAVHRAVLAAPRPHARHRRERIQGRALPPHRLRQRAFRLGHPGLEDRPRPHLYQVRPAGRDRIASLGRHLRAAVSKKAAARRPPIPFEKWRYRYIEGVGSDINHRVRRPHHDRANIT